MNDRDRVLAEFRMGPGPKERQPMTKSERLTALTKQIAAARRDYHRSLDAVCRTASGESLGEFDHACHMCARLERLAEEVAHAESFNPDAPMTTP
jgi:hypothetical protein